MEKQLYQFTDTSAENAHHQTIEALQEKDNRHTQLVQRLAAAIYTCDADGHITFFNQAAVELWGRTPEIGKDLWCGSWKIYEPDGVTPMALDSCPMAIALREGRTVRGQEIIVERPDGVRRNVMPHPDPIFGADGKVVEAVNMLVDITAIKHKEIALRESEERYKQIAQELERRVEERTSDLKEANVSLQRINAELEQFAFVASHDMQEPLRKIKSFTLRLENKMGEALDDVAKSYLAKIKYSSERMTSLIKGILDYSRLDYVEKHLEQTDLNNIFEGALNDLELSIEEKKAMIHAERLPMVKAVPLLMKQLFHNLLSNSLKFCKNEIPCQVTITSRTLTEAEATRYALTKKGSYCEIIFKDNGIGFNEQYAKDIFKIFERLNAKDTHEGTGIGLALCRKIVNIHQGDIFATSAINEGTVVHVLLPLA